MWYIFRTAVSTTEVGKGGLLGCTPVGHHVQHRTKLGCLPERPGDLTVHCIKKA